MFVIGLAASLSAGAEETDYLAIMLQGQKVGHAVHTRTESEGKVTTTEHVEMTLGRGGQAVKVAVEETHLETTDGKPLGFKLAMTTSSIEQKTTGTVKNGKALLITRQAMGQTQEQTVDWPDDALLSEGLRL
ncbi:MAG: hypothetical protein L0Y36_09700, partial [Planctomycetales bacterium]|nr:hypothetical protein [Planctomycetales bacterium]